MQKTRPRSLVEVLAFLYSDSASSERIATESELNVTHIAFHREPINVWHAIVQEARKENKLQQLIEVVVYEYPNNLQLNAAIQQLQPVPEPFQSNLLLPPGPRNPFPGLWSFRPTDSSLFFGRERQLAKLLSRLATEHPPLLVINGLSGVGKTSLLQAGLVPKLREQGYSVVYTRIVDSPHSDLLRGIRSEFLIDKSATESSVLELINNWVYPSQRGLILVIDQVESCFHNEVDKNERDAFWGEVAKLISGAARGEVQLIFSMRADWLYALQRVENIDIPIFNILFSLEPLTKEESKEALTGPLNLLKISYEQELIDTVIEDLADKYGNVRPPELQIVAQAVYQHASENTAKGQVRLTLADYRQLQGARAIIGSHLVRTVEIFGPDAKNYWKVLLLLAGNGSQREGRSENDLRQRLGLEEFDTIIKNLTRERLVVREISSRDKQPVYTLAHDYLLDEIRNYVEKDLELQGWQTAAHYLSDGQADWDAAMQRKNESGDSEGTEPILDRARYQHVWANRDALGKLSTKDCLFLLRSGLHHSDPTFSYWLQNVPKESKASAYEIVHDYGISQDDGLRTAASLAIVRAVNRDQLDEAAEKKLKESFIPSLSSAPTKAQKETAATILWSLRKYTTGKEYWQVAPLATRAWFHNNVTQVMQIAGAVLLVLGLVAATLWIRERMRGTWVALESDRLFAGSIDAAAIAPNDSNVIYAITPHGPTVGDGATLLRYDHSRQQWSVINRSLANNIRDLEITQVDDELRLYASIHANGLIRSKDQGKSWQMINSGLLSYDINQVEASPPDGRKLYAASADKKGIYRSTDGGDSWSDVSGKLLTGVSVTSITYTTTRDRWLVGTEDGTILSQTSISTEWESESAYAGIGAITILAPEEEERQVIYAGTSNGKILRSVDGGDVWIPLEKIPSTVAINSIAVVPGEPASLYANAFGVGGNVIWHSVDSGENWQPVGNSDFTREYAKLLIHPEAAQRLFVAGKGGLFEFNTTDATWQYATHVPAPIAGINRISTNYSANGPLYVAVAGAIYSKMPHATEWVRSQHLPAVSVRDIAVDPANASVAYAAIYLPNRWSVYKTTDGGINWQRTVTPTAILERNLNDTTAISVVSNGDRTTIYAGTNGCGLIVSQDGGESWDTYDRTDCKLKDNEPKNLIDIAVPLNSTEKLFVAADFTKVYSSTDGGRNWHGPILDLTTPIAAIETDPVIVGRLYLIAYSDGFRRSDDDAQNWHSPSTFLDGKSLVAMTVIPTQAETIIVATSNGEVFKSTNGGRSWSDISENLTAKSISVLEYDPLTQELILGTSMDGIYRYRAGELLGFR